MAPDAVLPWPKGESPLIGTMNFPLGTDLVIYRQQGGLWFAKDHTAQRGPTGELPFIGGVIRRPERRTVRPH